MTKPTLEQLRTIEMLRRIEKENYLKEMHPKVKEFYNRNILKLINQGVKYEQNK